MVEIIVQRLTDDPRLDLVGDHDLWAALLPLAHGYGEERAEAEGRGPLGMRLSTELLGILHGFRCLGAHLAWIDGRIVLERGQIEAKEYATLRGQYLMPRAAEVTMLLQRLAEVMRGKP